MSNPPLCCNCLEVISSPDNLVLLDCLHIVCLQCKQDMITLDDAKCPTCRINPAVIDVSLTQINTLITAARGQMHIYLSAIEETNCYLLGKKTLAEYQGDKSEIAIAHWKARKKMLETSFNELSDELLAFQAVAENLMAISGDSFRTVRLLFESKFTAAINHWEMRIARFNFIPLNRSEFDVVIYRTEMCYMVVVLSKYERTINIGRIIEAIVTYPDDIVRMDYAAMRRTNLDSTPYAQSVYDHYKSRVKKDICEYYGFMSVNKDVTFMLENELLYIMGK